MKKAPLGAATAADLLVDLVCAVVQILLTRVGHVAVRFDDLDELVAVQKAAGVFVKPATPKLW